MGVSTEGLRYEPGIGGRKERGRATDRAWRPDFDGPGTGVEGGPEGRGKAAAMCPVAGAGGSTTKTGTEMVRSAFLIDCRIRWDGDRIADCTSSVGDEGREGEPRNIAESDRGERLFVCIFGDFLRGRCVERRVTCGADRDVGWTTPSVR
jgi:hypothetical protein